MPFFDLAPDGCCPGGAYGQDVSTTVRSHSLRGSGPGSDQNGPSRHLWTSGWTLLPLQLFLGVTFVYAGLQKLADPNFLDAAASSSIQAQLSRPQGTRNSHRPEASAEHSPGPTV